MMTYFFAFQFEVHSLRWMYVNSENFGQRSSIQYIKSILDFVRFILNVRTINGAGSKTGKRKAFG